MPIRSQRALASGKVEQQAEPVCVAFASGHPALITSFLQQFVKDIACSHPLYVVSEFLPPFGAWIPWHPRRTFTDNLALLRSELRGKKIRAAAVLLQPKAPYRRMRLLGLLVARHRVLVYNENLHHFTLHPRSWPTIGRHLLWRAGELVRYELNPGGRIYTWAWRFRRPERLRRPLATGLANLNGLLIRIVKRFQFPKKPVSLSAPPPFGISVVIPTRNGRHLLARLLPELQRELAPYPNEILLIDNGSDDATADAFPCAAVFFEPLSFAQAANAGLQRARYRFTLLLNNDMQLQPNFFPPLLDAFDAIPQLFCATAQIFFPTGQRRQETGKAVTPTDLAETDFPIRCLEPLPGENLSWVLYGSGGCSLYDTAKLRALGGFDEAFHPAYVEDLDLGFRAWRQGWPTVFCARSQVLHHHQTTTSRYFKPDELELALERNYLLFVARAVSSPKVFWRLWKRAICRLTLRAIAEHGPSLLTLEQARQAVLWLRRPPAPVLDEANILALCSGEVAVFPGRPPQSRPRILIVSPYLPFPLSHGGAVRIYKLLQQTVSDFDVVLLSFTEQLEPPPQELLSLCAEVTLVRRRGSHFKRSTPLPDAIEEFNSPAMHAAVQLSCRKWAPALVQLEFTWMAQYERDCAPAKTILVEHDVTFDLYRQLAETQGDWEVRRQFRRWLEYEPRVWRQVDCVVVMSEQDRQKVAPFARVEVIPNGVDLDRFRPSDQPPEPGRLLFIGSFAHLPNLLALDFFLREVWPRLPQVKLHVIAGSDWELHLQRQQPRITLPLNLPGVEIEGFVHDVRPAYRRAAVVVAPLVASAGTNIKVLEALAMGKALVSTPAGVHGLELTPGRDFLLANDGVQFAEAVDKLLISPGARRQIELAARSTVERLYGWDIIAGRQKQLYESLIG
jgi:glycosyltransferase involved in cell wall biosynthesis/GT2 family glycosyltransferase